MTDSLVQPLEYSYTIDSLVELTESCGLDILLHCQNQFDIKNNSFSWNLRFEKGFMVDRYYSLPDIRRWQIANLLLCNDSPMLWFYFQRQEASFSRKEERLVCEEFLETRFRKNSMLLDNYLLTTEGSYRRKEMPVPYPAGNAISEPHVLNIFRATRPELQMKEVFRLLKVPMDFYSVNHVRIKLTTSGYPYLLAADGARC